MKPAPPVTINMRAVMARRWRECKGTAVFFRLGASEKT